MAKKVSENKIAISVAIITSIATIAAAFITGVFGQLNTQRAVGPSEVPPTAVDTSQETMGYQLFIAGLRKGYEPNFSCDHALQNLAWNLQNQHNVVVEGWFDGKKMDFVGAGYELFIDCVRVDYEPDWTRQQAQDNLIEIINKNPSKDVEGWYNGELITP